jgi:uncharacterized protein YjbI with pentapeptide repeats
MNESDNYSPVNPSAIQVGGNDLPDLKIYGYQVYEKLSEHLDLGKISYLAIDLKLDRLVVIKEWRRLDLAKPTSSPTTTAPQQQRQVPSLDYGNYLPEIERLQQLDHLNIPRYLNSFATPTGFCVVREYQSGVSLAELGDLPPSDIKLVAEAVLDILADLHRSTPIVIHHNIKPENIIINSEPTLKIYLVDLGLHRSKDPHASMSTPGFLPPPFLFSPEQISNPDIYSLGVSLICLITGTNTSAAPTLFDPTYRPHFKHLLPENTDPQLIQSLEIMVDPQHQQNNRQLNHHTTPVEHQSRSKQDLAELRMGFDNIPKLPQKIHWVRWGIGLSMLLGLGLIARQIFFPEDREPSPAEIAKNQAIAQKANFAASDRGRLLKEKHCPNCNLNYQNFSKAELTGANAPQANLTGADFSEANLTLAIFQDADLSSANFSKANLHQAAFYGAKLIGTNLVGANLSNSKLVYAKLKGAWLRDANLSHADLKFAEVQQVDLTRANLTGADLSNADLSYTNLHKAILVNTNLTGTNLTGATMPDGSVHP